ncbi:glutamate racemase [Cyanobacterium stanieri PCC 7202]|uniref:Glutamate racemase n=1 Tax=Cyanobacterium stanieri (strain ATCC 29140 / PCC 7202) TaxID=292563 RepID=K9YNJ2_CYASC|nr:glutamate racemase [Cyanobacterium stanieri PCC 7202]
MTNAFNNRIGVFDSGVGGLTVLRQIYRQLPQESILYFGDTKRLPYGTKSPQEILQFVREILSWMEKEEVKMVIMACNTSSALALEEVRAEFPFPILGLIHPGAKAAIKQGKRIGVISTVATASSNAYRNAINELEPDAKVWQIGCPEFVPLIEQNKIHDPYTKKVAQEYLEPLLRNRIDTLVYGCTHYPHLEGVLKEILPSYVKLVDPAYAVVRSTAKELEINGLRNREDALATRFCVSGDPEEFAQASKGWLGFTPHVEKIKLQPHFGIVDTPMEIRDNSEQDIYAESLIA